MKELFIYDFGTKWGTIFFDAFWNLLAWLGVLTLLREFFHFVLRHLKKPIKKYE